MASSIVDENSDILDQAIDEVLSAYIRHLEERGLPALYCTEQIAELAGVSHEELVRMINSSRSFYHSFLIPKRSGGSRLIQAPMPSILKVQRWMLSEILEKIPIEEVAHGFERGKSIVTNARSHVGKRCLLKCDLKDYFPTIELARIVGLFKSFGFSGSISNALARLTAVDDALVQGTATSPRISNLIARSLDKRLNALAISLNLTYSRYADDVAFSGASISLQVSGYIRSIVEAEGFLINERKTRLTRGKGKKIVAGISVGFDKPLVPKKFKRQLWSEVFQLLRDGIAQGSTFYKVFDPLYFDRVVGRINFVLFVEPDNAYFAEKLKALRTIAKEFEKAGIW